MNHFQVPKLFCPFVPELHPHMEEIEQQAMSRWAGYLGMYMRHPVFQKLRRSHFPQLLGRCHPTAEQERMCAALDFLIWNFAWDDHVDVGSVPAAWVRQQCEVALGVLQGTQPSHDAPPLLCLLAGIRERMVERMPDEWMERFIAACLAYFQGTIWEAEVRASRTCLSVDSYIQLRRLSVGTYMVFVQVEAVEGFLLPREVLEHPALLKLVEIATDVIAWANDLFSLAQDIQDDFHPNLVFSLQQERKLGLQEAIDVAVGMHDSALHQFLELEEQLPDFGEYDARVRGLVTGMRRWIRANVDWSIQTGRYQEHAPSAEA